MTRHGPLPPLPLRVPGKHRGGCALVLLLIVALAAITAIAT